MKKIFLKIRGKIHTCFYLFILTVAFPACEKWSDGKIDSSSTEKTVIGSLDRQADEVYIASVGKGGITVSEFKEAADSPDGFITGDAEEQKRNVLDHLIRLEGMAQKAVTLGLHNDPEVRDVLKKMLVRKLKEREWYENINAIVVEESEVEQQYNNNSEKYRIPEKRRAALIFFRKNGKNRNSGELKNKVQQIHKIASKSSETEFAELVKKYSDDEATKYKGGLTYWIGQNSRIYNLEREVVDAVSELKKTGDISPVIETSKGYYLARLTHLIPSASRTLDEVRSEIRQELLRTKKDDWIKKYYEELIKSLDVKVDYSLLDKTEVRNLGSFAEKPPSFPLAIE